MLYELEKTPNYRFQYNKLSLKLKRFINEALDILKEYPTEYQGKILHLANRKEFHMYRFRVPGAYIIYLLHKDQPLITLTSVIVLR